MDDKRINRNREKISGRKDPERKERSEKERKSVRKLCQETE